MNEGRAELEAKAFAGDAAARMTLVRALEAQGQKNDAILWLRRGAADGDIEARTALGRAVLVGDTLPVDEGLVALVSAANDGGAEAAYLVSILLGSGLGIRQNWQGALVYLQRAAELGHAPARRQLALLSGNPSLGQEASSSEPSPDLWRRLRESIDLSTWLKPVRPRVHSIAPRIGIVENFLSPELCDWLVEKARPMISPAQTWNRATGDLGYEAGRTNSAAYINVPDFDFTVLLARHRMAAATGCPIVGFEAPTILHYAPGQEFAPHWDYFDPEVAGYAARMNDGGQRIVTFLVYLNDDFEGAETDFPVMKWRYRGKKGDAIFFWNVDPSGAPDKRTYHAGLPPTRGEKWLLSQWIRERAAQPPVR
jgi:hypothetical protein